jgi:hypothetical protein
MFTHVLILHIESVLHVYSRFRLQFLLVNFIVVILMHSQYLIALN